MLGFYNLPLNYFQTYADKINAVTAKDIRSAFEQHVNPENMATVMVGPVPGSGPKN